MPDFNKPQPPIKSESTTVIGVVNQAVPDPFKVASCFGSMSYTVSENKSDAPSQPLSAGAVRVVNSVLDARVNEAAVRRDRSEDF